MAVIRTDAIGIDPSGAPRISPRRRAAPWGLRAWLLALLAVALSAGMGAASLAEFPMAVVAAFGLAGVAAAGFAARCATRSA